MQQKARVDKQESRVLTPSRPLRSAEGGLGRGSLRRGVFRKVQKERRVDDVASSAAPGSHESLTASKSLSPPLGEHASSD